MRILLLLSALLTAFVGSGGVARAGVVPACQVSALVDVVAARGAVATAGRRPLVFLPSVRDVLVARVAVDAPAGDVPLYAGRLRV